MFKKFLSFFVLFTVIILMGAGCQNTAPVEVEEELDDLAILEDEYNNEEQSDLILSVEALGNGQVRFIWNKSDNPGGYKLLHSSRPEAENPFWQNVMTDNDEATFYNVPTGTRYFRICEMEEKECVKYSNEVELEVK